ncbi:MAG TPA: MaoC family dehydratase N-terminal domain-containing protein [Ilumatobacter sp.]|nr:MaoC family dehydratase N-terminal domain-containing protein [Ilumatobacter sp.]
MQVERFPVESAHIAMFARSINDPNPVYYDPDYAASTELGGIPAPPTFVQASAQFDPDYFLRPKFDEPWFGSGREATGIVREPTADGTTGGGLHAEQHYEYHLPLLAGDVLTATTREGDQWEKQGRRGGTLQFSEMITEYRNAAGDLVVTARGVGVRTGQVVEQDG